MASDVTSPADGSPDSFDTLRAAFAKSYADFHQSHLCLAMVAGTHVSEGVLNAITGRGFCIAGGGVVHVAGDTYSFSLVSADKDEPAVSRFHELAARGGAWLLATGRLHGERAAYSNADTLWFHAICEAFRGTKSQDCDGIAYWPLNPFAALIETLRWLEQQSAQPTFTLLDRYPATLTGHIAFLESVRDEVHNAAEAKRNQLAQKYPNATIKHMVGGIKWAEAGQRVAVLSGLPAVAVDQAARVLQRELTVATVEQIDELFTPAVRNLRDAWENREATKSAVPAVKAGEGDFIERLLAGPDDAELSPRDLALLEAHLNQRVSLSQLQREAKAEGKSESARRRKKLKLIRDFNRNLRAAAPAAKEAAPANPVAQPPDATAEAALWDERAFHALVNQATAEMHRAADNRQYLAAAGQFDYAKRNRTLNETADQWVAEFLEYERRHAERFAKLPAGEQPKSARPFSDERLQRFTEALQGGDASVSQATAGAEARLRRGFMEGRAGFALAAGGTNLPSMTAAADTLMPGGAIQDVLRTPADGTVPDKTNDVGNAVHRKEAETKTAQPDSASAPNSPTGFLGGAELADALGIHATRRGAFFRQLERQRRSLGDGCWHQVANPLPNSPQYLYRLDAPQLRDMAAAYTKPKRT